ncbi:hypothetical protein C8R46DRAFT_1137310 [Mycena filopes]|nr:hypothetical protein C8R46DRAFT_1137310 [Mycena filopes]
MPLRYSTGLALMRDSPHIATYVRRLTITLPHLDTPLVEVEAIPWVLKSLANVRCCLVFGQGGTHLQAWPLDPVGLALIEFIAQQKLDELHVISVGTISPAAISVFLGASTVTIMDCAVDTTLPRALSSPSPLIAKNLLLVLSPTVVALLMSPEYLSRLDVHKLWVEPDDIYGRLALLAENLRHLRLACEDNYEPANGRILPRVAMPLLESAELDSHFDDPPDILLDFISSVLALTPPTLAEICVTFSTWPLTPLPSATVTAVHNLLAAASQRPRMRWRLDFRDSPEGWNALREFDDSLRADMPSLASTGRLIVERYAFTEDEINHWFVPRVGTLRSHLSRLLICVASLTRLISVHLSHVDVRSLFRSSWHVLLLLTSDSKSTW